MEREVRFLRFKLKFFALEAYLLIKNRTDPNKILGNDIWVKLFNLQDITFGDVLDQCKVIWNLKNIFYSGEGGDKKSDRLY